MQRASSTRIAVTLAFLLGLIFWLVQEKPIPPQTSATDGGMSTAPVMLPDTSGNLTPGNLTLTLEQAKMRLRTRLADLERMTPEEWQAQTQDRLEQYRRDHGTPVDPYCIQLSD